ncbi:MAG TPA: hypothetical protein VMU22_10200 [Rhizomicrobium sp.]|nr:hypothetical protein [Rhizomicrobium sp.]
MSPWKFATAAGVAAALSASSSSAAITSYVRCDASNVRCVRVACNDETGKCRWANGYSDRYGSFMRAELAGYFRSDGRWLCVRGPRCNGPDEVVAAPPIDPTPPSP